MKLVVTRRSLRVIPETELDEAFLEEVLGLREKGDSCPLVRVEAMGLPHTWAYAQAKHPE